MDLIVYLIIACEIAFWLVLGAGLAFRYVLGFPRLGAILLIGVPVVDVVLLVVTGVDLWRGAPADQAHGLAAVYVGFSVALGPSIVRWADQHVAARFATERQAGSAALTPQQAEIVEWKAFGRACGAVAISVLLLMAEIAIAADNVDTAALWSWIPRLGLVLVIWMLGWPIPATVKAAKCRAVQR